MTAIQAHRIEAGPTFATVLLSAATQSRIKSPRLGAVIKPERYPRSRTVTSSVALSEWDARLEVSEWDARLEVKDGSSASAPHMGLRVSC
jgi:hypothetical protein